MKHAMILAGFAGFLLSVLVPVRADENTVVVELFTSQGCVACPPADRVMAEIAQVENVVALSWAVDYWDYLGWEDTFGKASHTERQELYNDRLGVRGVYTPQVVINGKREVVGSKGEAIRNTIHQLRSQTSMPVDAEIVGDWDNLDLLLSDYETDKPLTIRMIWFDASRTVDISYGDNQGRTLHYTNIVRGSEVIDLWDGEGGRRDLDLSKVLASGSNCIAILVQEGDGGKIVGASKIILSQDSPR